VLDVDSKRRYITVLIETTHQWKLQPRFFKCEMNTSDTL
jgi:hypothetical protein